MIKEGSVRDVLYNCTSTLASANGDYIGVTETKAIQVQSR